MGLLTPSPARLASTARSLNLRADQLDRDGKHAAAVVMRRKAERIEAKAAMAATPYPASR